MAENGPMAGDNVNFDDHALNYDDQLMQGLRLTGEGRQYYAAKRIEFTRALLERLAFRPRRILDFGCGTGDATPHFHSSFQPQRITGVDISEASLRLARQQFGAAAEFVHMTDFTARGAHDLAFCNGVFHHIAPRERLATARFVFDALAPGGMFALWENNPWNLGTRLIMSRVPFDRDAILLWPRQTRRLLAAAGFRIRAARFYFIFPRPLRALRPIERLVHRLPLGGQYLTLAQRPA